MAYRPTPSDRTKKLPNVTPKPAAKKSIVHGKDYDTGEMNHKASPWPHTTGLQSLDEHVMIQPGQFFQIVAAGGGGKTEFCHTMTAEALHHHEDGKIIIIDYTKAFNPLRIKEELMTRFGAISEDKVNEQLRRVTAIAIRDLKTLIDWLRDFEIIYKDSKIIMVIIENIALLLASTHQDMDYYRTAGERDQILLFSLCQKLFNKFPIIFTNYISSWNAQTMKPALGKLYWNKRIPLHILLVRHRNEFHAQVFNMVEMKKYETASGILKFYLSRRGVTCSKQEAENEPSKWWMYGPQEINAAQDIPAEKKGSAERYEVLFGDANDFADENDEITSKIDQLSIASRFNKIPQPAPSSTKSIERGSLPWEPNIAQNDVTIVGEKRQKFFCPNGFVYKNLTRYSDNNRYVDYFDEILVFQSPIILESLHNFYLNVYHDVALAGVDFFEALNDNFKNHQQILERLLNYDENITTRIIGLLEDNTVMTLNLLTFDLYHYDPYAPNESFGKETRIQNLEALIPKLKALFDYDHNIKMEVGNIPNELVQEKVKGNEYFGCCVMELLIKYTNLPNITGIEFENLRKRFQSWCYEVLKFGKNPQWIPFGSPLNYFKTVKNIHKGGPVNISLVARYIHLQIQVHSTVQRQIGFFDPAWLNYCDEYPIELIVEKFGKNCSANTKKLIFLVAIEEHQFLFEYYDYKLICKNSIVSYGDNPAWKKCRDAIRSKIRPILKEIFNDRDYVRYNAKIDQNLVQHQNCPIDSALFVVKFADLTIQNVKHEGPFNPEDSRKLLKNAFSLKFIDFRIADLASSNVLGVERYFKMIGFQIHPVLQDGSSFYRAVAVALGRDEDNHRKLRIASNIYLSRHQDDYYQLFDQISVDEHLQNQAQIDMPVELVDIIVLSDMEKKGILLVESGRDPTIFNQQMPEQIILVRTSIMSDNYLEYYTPVIQPTSDLHQSDYDDESDSTATSEDDITEAPSKSEKLHSIVQITYTTGNEPDDTQIQDIVVSAKQDTNKIKRGKTVPNITPCLKNLKKGQFHCFQVNDKTADKKGHDRRSKEGGPDAKKVKMEIDPKDDGPLPRFDIIKRPIGLTNDGIKCYINTAIQCLLVIPEFASAIDSFVTATGGQISYYLRQIIQKSKDGTNAVSTNDIFNLLVTANEQTRQQDIMEFMLQILETVSAELSTVDKGQSFFKKYYACLKNIMTPCPSCKRVKIESDEDTSFMVPLNGGVSTLQQAILQSLYDPEKITGRKCEDCGEINTAYRTQKYSDFPKIMTFHLGRFNSNGEKKLLSIKLPSYINLNPVMKENGQSDKKPELEDLNIPFSTDYGWSSEARDSSRVQQVLLKQGPYVYELLSIAVHIGNADAGHYCAIVKSPDIGWNLCNDKTVTTIYKLDDDVGVPTGSYILQYRRVDKVKAMIDNTIANPTSLTTPTPERSFARPAQTTPKPIPPASSNPQKPRASINRSDHNKPNPASTTLTPQMSTTTANPIPHTPTTPGNLSFRFNPKPASTTLTPQASQLTLDPWFKQTPKPSKQRPRTPLVKPASKPTSDDNDIEILSDKESAPVQSKTKEDDSSKSTEKPSLSTIVSTPKPPSSTAETPMESTTKQRPRRPPPPPPVEDSSDSIDSTSNSNAKNDSAVKSKTGNNPKPPTKATAPDTIDISDDSDSSPQPPPKSASKNIAGSKKTIPKTSSTITSFFEKKPQKSPTTPISSTKKPNKEESTSKNAKALPVPTLSDDDSIVIDSASDSDKSKTGKKRKATKKRPKPSKPTKKNYRTVKPKAKRKTATRKQPSMSPDILDQDLLDDVSDDSEDDIEIIDDNLLRLTQINDNVEIINATRTKPVTEEEFDAILIKQAKLNDEDSTMYLLGLQNETNDPEVMLDFSFYYGFTTQINIGKRQILHESNNRCNGKGPLAGFTEDELNNVVIIPIKKGKSTPNKILEALYIHFGPELPPVYKNIKIEPINCPEIEDLINVNSNQREHVKKILLVKLQRGINDHIKTLPPIDQNPQIHNPEKIKFQKLLNIINDETKTPRERLLEVLEFVHPHEKGDWPCHCYAVGKILDDIKQTIVSFIYFGKTKVPLALRRFGHENRRRSSAIYSDLQGENGKEYVFIQLLWEKTNELKALDFEALHIWFGLKKLFGMNIHLRNRYLEKIRSPLLKKLILNIGGQYNSHLNIIKEGLIENFTTALQRLKEAGMSSKTLEFIYYTCQQCGKPFALSSTLKTHERTHSDDKPHKCKECGASFAQLGNLKDHERTHTGEKPYECKYCGLSFAQHNTLKRHERTHTGEKPHKCPYQQCDYSATTSGNLKRHEREIHIGHKSFVCKVCGKSFAQSDNLKRHERTHTGEKPHKCPYQQCTYSSATSGNLKRHERTVHTHKKQHCRTRVAANPRHGGNSAIKAIFKANLVHFIANFLDSSDRGSRIVALSAICNIISVANEKQSLEIALDMGVACDLCNFLSNDDGEIVAETLESLTHLLQNSGSRVKEVAESIQGCGGVDIINDLQKDDDETIKEKSKHLMTKYFS